MIQPNGLDLHVNETAARWSCVLMPHDSEKVTLTALLCLGALRRLTLKGSE